MFLALLRRAFRGDGVIGSVRGITEAAAAFGRGERDPNRLSNVIFHARHPELGGRSIARGETELAREWLWIRDAIVRPALARATGGGPSSTAPPRPPRAAPRPTGAASCPPVAARPAEDRCLNPGTRMCPAIANLVCLRDVGGVPFEYPTLIRRDPTTGLVVVGRRQTPRTQRFIPAVRDALLSFTAMMAQFRMPIEAILTAGSLYCRCIRGTNTLSNHSFGDAIDIVGVRWPPVGGPPSRLRETIVHNWADPGERALLRRMNAVLRLSFTTVIDYHRPDHRDHFHCDMNRGQARRPRSRNNLTFVQEALGVVLGRAIPVTARWDAATQRALSEFSGASATALEQDDNLNRILGALFARVAAGR